MAVYPRYLQEFEAIATPFVAAPAAEQALGTPLAAIHRRMLLILSLVLLVIVPLLVRILPAHNQAAIAAPQASSAPVASDPAAAQEETGPVGCRSRPGPPLAQSPVSSRPRCVTGSRRLWPGRKCTGSTPT
jgi:hypothetical protein